MNLTWLDHPHLWDAVFAAILLFCIITSAKKGAVKAISGTVGTVLGCVVATTFQSGLTPFLETKLQPMLLRLIAHKDITQTVGIPQTSDLNIWIGKVSELKGSQGEVADTLREKIFERLAEALSARFAPILAFLILFFLVKLVIRLACALLDLEIPFFSDINHVAGGVLGAVSGAMLILVLCWAVMRFGPAENAGLLDRLCLERSYVGGFLVPRIAALLGI